MWGGVAEALERGLVGSAGATVAFIIYRLVTGR